MEVTAAALRAELAAELGQQGFDPRIVAAFEHVPREVFLPDVLPVEPQHSISRADDPAGWLRAAYTDDAMVTQRDEGRAGGLGVPTSSSSAPSVMAAMLQALDAGGGMRVLEVGAGTGYNAALLCELTGPGGVVTTVEVDPALAVAAAAALARGGFNAHVATGRGEDGCSTFAPYDRIIATCTLPRIPAAWMIQARHGCVIVAPWNPSPGGVGGLLARLDVRDRAAEGRFLSGTSFMWSREVSQGGRPEDLGRQAQVVREAEGDERQLLLEGEGVWWLNLAVPAWRFGMRSHRGDRCVWVSATDGASWARVYADRVEQGGPRRVWNELTAARRWWEEQGKPGAAEFGLTVSRQGEHRAWYGSPQGQSWLVAA